jgi:hypothetical protein
VHDVLAAALALAAASAAAATASREKIKEVGHAAHPSAAAPRAAHAFFDRFLAVAVVDLALLGVAEDVVGLVDLLELVGGAAWVLCCGEGLGEEVGGGC